jgi:glucuronate isomerase
MTGTDVTTFGGFLDAIRLRRAAFRARGATATDHDVPRPYDRMASAVGDRGLHTKALKGALRPTRPHSTTVTC